MHTLDVIDSALQWETERQNRLHQQAVELKKKQARDETRSAMASVPQVPDEPKAASEPALNWPDKVSRIPDMRSALIPFDAADEGSDWSKPFALTKADIEPWTSILAGYNQSRLFLQPASAAADLSAAQAQDPSRLDYAVRALLALKRVSAKLILEPPVQINRQVEYYDQEAELRAAEGRLRTDTLLKLALEMHQKQLAKAVEMGRQLGDTLYEAMMGEGYCNLVKAWERAHGRKPSVEELHVMLSSGKVKPIIRAAEAADERSTLREAPVAAQREQGRAPAPRIVVPLPAAASIPDDDEADARVTLGGPSAIPPAARPAAPQADKPENKPGPRRRIHWYLLHAAATASSAAALAYFWLP